MTSNKLLVQVLTSVILALFTAADAEGDEYQIAFRDGFVATTGRLSGVDDIDRDIRVAGRSLFRGARHQQVRMIRTATSLAANDDSTILLANGDQLRGRIQQWLPDGPTSPAKLIVIATDPAFVGESVRVEIWPHAVKRICPARAAARDRSKGDVRLNDGKRLQAKLVRWSSRGVDVLTSTGVVSVKFDDIRDLTMPGVDVFAGLEADVLLAQSAMQTGQTMDKSGQRPGHEGEFIVGTSTQSGSRLSFPRRMVWQGTFTATQDKRVREPIVRSVIAVRPSWSLTTILVDAQMIACRVYRSLNEVSLSALPAREVRRVSAIQNLGWTRNSNVLGQPLGLGEVTRELGVGIHSETSIAFELPRSAKRFSARLGVDRAANGRGCIQCAVGRITSRTQPSETSREDETVEQLWRSEIITGASEVASTGSLDVSRSSAIVLTTNWAHRERPKGADPLDIRDFSDWVDAWVEVDWPDVSGLDLHAAIPALAGWTLSEDSADNTVAAPTYDERDQAWRFALRPRSSKVTKIELQREMKVTLLNARLRVEAMRESTSSSAIVSAALNGQHLPTTLNGDIKLYRKNEFESREWNLGAFDGETVTLSLIVSPTKSDQPIPGVMWSATQPTPLIDNLPVDGKPLKPHVLLTALKPTDAYYQTRRQIPLAVEKLVDGKLADERATPLEIRGYRFKTGFGVPTGTHLKYELDPTWKRFVAVGGLAGGWRGAGPYEVWLDGERVWTSGLEHGRNSTALQIDVPIAAGHKEIEIVVLGYDDCFGALANAGFKTK